MELTIWILLVGTAVVLLVFFLYRHTTLLRIRYLRDLSRSRRALEEWEEWQREADRRRREAAEEWDDEQQKALEREMMVRRADIFGPETTETNWQEPPETPLWLRLSMQVLVTMVVLVIGVMLLFDGCYALLGWCDEPAGEAAKNWASGLVGTVVGFWLTKA